MTTQGYSRAKISSKIRLDGFKDNARKRKKRSPNGLRSRHFTADFYPRNAKKCTTESVTNAVGYMDVAKESGTTYYGGGTMFLTPGQGTYRLYDLSLKPTSGNITANQFKTQTIAFMLAGSPKTDSSKTFYFAGATNGDKKWHYATTVDGVCVKDAVVPDFEIPAGTGFFCTFGREVTVVCAGEVLAKSGVPTAVQKPSTDTTYFFAANPLPRAVSLSEISLSPVSGNITANQFKTQTIAFMLAGSPKTDSSKTYYFAGATNGDKKWHYATTVDGVCVKDAVVENADEIMIPAGKGFFCTFGRAVQINFPVINY